MQLLRPSFQSFAYSWTNPQFLTDTLQYIRNILSTKPWCPKLLQNSASSTVISGVFFYKCLRRRKSHGIGVDEETHFLILFFLWITIFKSHNIIKFISLVSTVFSVDFYFLSTKLFQDPELLKSITIKILIFFKLKKYFILIEQFEWYCGRTRLLRKFSSSASFWISIGFPRFCLNFPLISIILKFLLAI